MRARRLVPMLLASVSLLLLPSHSTTSFAEQVKTCSPQENIGKICDYPNGQVCINKTCTSACALRGLLRCECSRDDEQYCYLCCGNANTPCQPAHQLEVLRPNGEFWERDSCKRCRSLPNGLTCDDKDKERLCQDGKCTNTICYGKREGEYCDIQKDKICVDNQCRNPCHGLGSRVCDCPDLDPDTGMRSDDRCQLCCFNYKSKRCENAFKQHSVKFEDRPIARVGLTCQMGMKSCNRYGVCAACSIHANTILIGFLTFTLIAYYQADNR